jgi:anti-anti-sigma factor
MATTIDESIDEPATIAGFRAGWHPGPPAEVYAHGELDMSTSDVLGAALAEACAHGAHPAILDLSGTTFIDAYSMRLLAGWAARGCCPEGVRDLRVVGATAFVARVLRLAGLGHLLAAS